MNIYNEPVIDFLRVCRRTDCSNKQVVTLRSHQQEIFV